MGTLWVTPSPESSTIPEGGGAKETGHSGSADWWRLTCHQEEEEQRVSPVVRPEAYSERTAWIATYMAGTLKVSNMI